MQAANVVSKTLKKGGVSFGGWQMLSGTNIARFIANSGLDWICVDTEHGNIDDGQMHEAVSAIAASRTCSPIVRIAANESWMVKRALDCGAHGIMVPLLQTPQEAQQLVQAAKFPPQGRRGFGSPFSMGNFAVTETSLASTEATTKIPTQIDYLQQANEALLTIVQIETKEALANIDAIAGTPGIDVLFVGPFDLGNNIGHPILAKGMDAELIAAIDTIKTAAEKAGKISGIYSVDGNQARTYADQGFKMISVGGDFQAIPTYFSQQLGAAKGGILHGVATAAKGAASAVTNQGSK